MPTQGELDLYESDREFLWDYERWEEYSSVIPTRRQAIEDAVGA